MRTNKNVTSMPSHRACALGLLALAVFGCGATPERGGSGGIAGTGGSDGAGGGGSGGSAGTGGMALACLPVEDFLCVNADIDPIEPCCALLAPPDQENACTGNERLVNPTSCTATGTTVAYRLTLLKVADDCNVGYDLDGCVGTSCLNGGIAPNEGMNGVDNALAGLAPIFDAVGTNLNCVNQPLSDALCGLTDDPELGTCMRGTAEPGTECTIIWTCEGGANDGVNCALADDCPDGTCVEDDGCPDAAGKTCEWGDNDGNDCSVDDDCPLGRCSDNIGTCRFGDDDCSMSILPFEALFVIDANPAESCANVQVSSGGDTSDVIVNISTPANEGDPVCASGTLGTIPVTIGGVAGAFGNAVIRMTVSANGFSDGLLGATIGEATLNEVGRHCHGSRGINFHFTWPPSSSTSMTISRLTPRRAAHCRPRSRLAA